jgi:hypothetical protein
MVPPFPSEPPEGAVVVDPAPAVSVGLGGTLTPSTSLPPSSGSLDSAGSSGPSQSFDAFEAEAILPSEAELGDEFGLLHAEYSPELQQLLAAAAQRVHDGSGPPSSVPPLDSDAVGLSPELLAMLDEPLTVDDEDSRTGTPRPERGSLSSSAGSYADANVGTGDLASSSDVSSNERSPSEVHEATPAPNPMIAASAMPSPAAQDRPPDHEDGASRSAPPAPSAAPEPLVLPAVLGEGDAVVALARAIAGRATGALVLSTERGARRIMLHEGDIATVGSEIADEALIAFLGARGDIQRDSASLPKGKLPSFGRHAGAALVAHGHLTQDELWPVLRDHAEWILARALAEPAGTCAFEHDPPPRYVAEPGVLGGAAGAAILVETLRRVVPSDVALRRLGGINARLDEGSNHLLGECGLRPDEENALWGACGKTIGDVVSGPEDELLVVLYAVVAFGVLTVLAPVAPPRPAKLHVSPDPFDAEAIRMRVSARMALVEDADYFALLGVSRDATSYEIRRAYLALRRAFEPARLLTHETADLATDVRLIVEVLDEAFDILREPQRRERYQRAIEASPP